MSSENDGKLMVNSLIFYYPARVTQKSPRDFCAQVFFIYMHLYKTMRSNNQGSRRIPVFPCQIVWYNVAFGGTGDAVWDSADDGGLKTVQHGAL